MKPYWTTGLVSLYVVGGVLVPLVWSAIVGLAVGAERCASTTVAPIRWKVLRRLS